MTKSKAPLANRTRRVSHRKDSTLRSSQDIGWVLKSGRRFRGKYVSIVYLSRPAVEGIRVGFTASKSIRSAVDRNRMKRLMRETFRKKSNRILSRDTKTGLDIVLLCSQTSPTISLKDIENDFDKFLDTITQEDAA